MIQKLVCILCEKEVLPSDKIYWVALEFPYMNLIVHRQCYNACEDIDSFIKEHLENYLKLYKNEKKKV